MHSRLLRLMLGLAVAATLAACAGTVDRCTADTSPPPGSAEHVERH